MPRAKRPLTEADPNASTSASRRRKSAKIVDSKDSAEQDLETSSTVTIIQENRETHVKLVPKLGEQIDYKSKDNSKLRRLLSERDLLSDGPRNDLIRRLESSSINYEYLESGKISEMLRDRSVKYAGQGSKQLKIQRLRLNDQLEYDTGPSGGSLQYGKFHAMELTLEYELADQPGNEMTPADGRKVVKNYSSRKDAALCKILKERGLVVTGSRESLISRLMKDDREKSESRIRTFKAIYDMHKCDLEALRGRPLDAAASVRAFDKKTAEIERLDDEVRLRQSNAT